MEWRAPWLSRRKTGIVTIAAEAVVLMTTYALFFQARFGNKLVEPGNSLYFLVACWVVTSYLVGRYSEENEARQFVIKRKWAALVTTFIAVVAVSAGVFWAFGLNSSETALRGFIVPVIATNTAACLALEAFIGPKGTNRKNWVIICDEKEKDIIIEEAARTDKESLQRIRFCTWEEVRREDMDELLSGCFGLCLGHSSNILSEYRDIIQRQREQGKEVLPLISWCERYLQCIPPELISVEWLISADGFRLRPGSWNWRLKRLGDITVATILLIATLPVMCVAAIAIKLNDKGPILYQQLRTGFNREQITVHKLRSMYVNSEIDGAQWSKRHDSRVTSVGKLLRALRVDELPQLVGVISGKLSLIGPRPERPEIEECLEQEIPNYGLRHWAKPGLSGWAQVCYPYGSSVKDSRCKLAYDLYYLRNAGPLMDILIGMKTIRVILGAGGTGK